MMIEVEGLQPIISATTANGVAASNKLVHNRVSKIMKSHPDAAPLQSGAPGGLPIPIWLLGIRSVVLRLMCTFHDPHSLGRENVMISCPIREGDFPGLNRSKKPIVNRDFATLAVSRFTLADCEDPAREIQLPPAKKSDFGESHAGAKGHHHHDVKCPGKAPLTFLKQSLFFFWG